MYVILLWHLLPKCPKCNRTEWEEKLVIRRKGNSWSLLKTSYLCVAYLEISTWQRNGMLPYNTPKLAYVSSARLPNSVQKTAPSEFVINYQEQCRYNLCLQRLQPLHFCTRRRQLSSVSVLNLLRNGRVLLKWNLLTFNLSNASQHLGGSTQRVRLVLHQLPKLISKP